MGAVTKFIFKVVAESEYEGSFFLGFLAHNMYSWDEWGSPLSSSPHLGICGRTSDVWRPPLAELATFAVSTDEKRSGDFAQLTAQSVRVPSRNFPTYVADRHSTHYTHTARFSWR